MAETKTHRVRISFSMDVPAKAVGALGDGSVAAVRAELGNVAYHAAKERLEILAHQADEAKRQEAIARAQALREKADELEREAGSGAGA